MLLSMRRFVGMLALLSVAASPTVARARTFCRFTGVEMGDCEEQRVPDRAPDRAILQAEGCCERRVAPALGDARISPEHVTVAPKLVAVALAPPLHSRPGPTWAATSRVSTGSGPPLYVVQRALLI